MFNKLKQSVLDLYTASLPNWLDRFERFARDPGRIQALVLWAAALTVGLSAVLYAKVFKLVEEWFQSFLEHNQLWVFVLTPVFFLIAWLLVHYLAPNASGSGIPQIMAANEIPPSENTALEIETPTDRLLSLRTAAVKIFSSLICVAGGGAIGREGPTLQISASLFYFFGRFVKKYIPSVQTHTFIVAGAAAGLASAFNTPLGGIVYAIEELGGHNFHRVKTSLLSAVIISGLMAQWILGSYLYLGLPTVAPAGAEFVGNAILAGFVSGVGGACFGILLYRLVQVRWSLKSIQSMGAMTVVCGLLMAGLAYYDRRNAGTGLGVITNYLFTTAPSSPILILSRFAATCLSYLSGAAGGIFSPALSIGAAIGAELSDFISSSNHNLMVLLGMIGFLTGVTRTPFTAFILVIEMSDRHAAILPMMIAAGVAQLSASLLAPHGFYELVKERYMPKSEAAPKPEVHHV